MKRILMVAGLGLIFSACGGSGDSTSDDAPAAGDTPVAQPAQPDARAAEPEGPLTVPEWFSHDETSGDVHLEIVAGATDAKNYWNFNGYTNGAISIVVPVGSTVTVDFTNRDPVMAHSLGLSNEVANFGMPPAANPVFEGAITSDPTSMVSSTLPGESETIRFVADEAGNYSMVCYIAGHTAVGMWIYFEVADDGSAGVRGL